MSDVTPRKEKKDKKRKSEAGLAEIAPVAPEAGSASAEAVTAEVDAEKAAKKAKKEKKEKRKSLAAGEGEAVEASKDAKVGTLLDIKVRQLTPPGRVPRPAGCHLANSVSDCAAQAAEEAVQDGQALVEGSTAQAGCEGGGQGAEEG